MQLLASVVKRVSVKTLRDIDPDILFSGNKDEVAVFNFIREHHDEHQVLPTKAVIEDSTGYLLPTLQKRQPVSFYLKRCQQRAMTRGIVDPFNRLQEAMQNPRTSVGDMSEAIEDLYRVHGRFLHSGTGIEMSDALIETILRKSRERSLLGSTVLGIPTGYDALDREMDGYNKGDLVVWVGRPGRSKSWFLLRQAYSAWMAGYKPLYISMEMDAEANMRRMLGFHSRVNPNIIKRGQIGTLARPLFEAKAHELLRLRPLHMVSANFSRTVDQIANFIDEYSPDICFIDAGYLLSPKKKRYGAGGRRETIADVIEELKELGVNAGIPIVITVQFNRNAEQRRRGANARRREGQDDREGSPFNPISHLSLAEIGETDVIGQAASHILGIELPPQPLPVNSHRVFGFLKGREGEDGWWLTRFMETKSSPVNLDIVPPDDPAYLSIINGGQSARNRPQGQRSASMSIQD